MSESDPPSADGAARPPTAAAASGARIPRWVVAALLGGGLAIIALLVIVIVLLLGGKDETKTPTASDPGSASASTDTTMLVFGDITLIDSGNSGSGGSCYGTGGYDDMHGGTQVVIKDASGTAIAVGALDEGVEENSVTCRFDFKVADVPVGGEPYSLEVSHRGSFAFTEETAGGIHLSLG